MARAGTTPDPTPDWRTLVVRALFALLIGFAGVQIFLYFHLPLPWLLGSLTACLVASVARLPLAKPRPLVLPMRMVLGLAIGSAFTPALAGRISEMALSLAFIPPFVLAMTFVGVPFFMRIARFDRPTAFFAAMPGGFNDMLAMGRDAGANQRQLSLAHATRILIIVFVTPFWLQWTHGLEIGVRPAGAVGLLDVTAIDAVLMVACGIGGWWGARRLGISGAAIIGPMAVSAVLHVVGIVTFKVPAELINLAQLVIGTHVGCQFLGITAREFTTTVSASVVYAVYLLLLTALFTTIVVTLTGIDVPSVVLAYSPGGQAEMNIMAVVLGTDVAYVALHHITRVALVVVGAQIVFRRVWGKGRPPTRPDDD